jgi:hypothetical protein
MKRVARLVLIFAVTALAVLNVSTAPASATGYSQSYCGYLVNSGYGCYASGVHSWDQNFADYYGGGSVWICAGISNTSGTVVEESCNWNHAHTGWVDRSCACYYAWIIQYSGNRHTIYGYATA